ncbi:MAG: nitrate/sulfonate/bicarbonate ABC transporter ATP-binding protein [Pirellulales bacterium]|nr:nitrate/sulfonate/bicarbonate ABC transporter ATP-binding protein [Pirellulales bacterium]
MGAPNDSPICEARGVSVAFGSQVVLEDVSLAIQAGEVVAILGPSGCGKSTLLRVLVGLLRPTVGEVLAHGQPLVGIHPGVAIVFQSFALYPWLTVRQNVEVGLNRLRLDRAMARERVTRCIDLVGLEGYEESYPKELSGGMKQRVGIARALVREPELLFMDEPFSNLDVFTAESLRSETYALWVGGQGDGRGSRRPTSLRSIVLITHIIEEAVFLADRIVIMGTKPGHIRQVLQNNVPHPREYQSAEFLKMVGRIHHEIVSEHMPDEAAAGARRAEQELEPIPLVDVGEIVGLMEMVLDHHGRVSVFVLDQLTDFDFGHTLAVVMAGEMLDFLDTPREMVVLTDLGRRFLLQGINGRKAIFRDQLLKLPLFSNLIRRLEKAEHHELPRDVIEEQLVLQGAATATTAADLFDKIVAWGRFGELLGYSPDTEMLYQMERREAAP